MSCVHELEIALSVGYGEDDDPLNKKREYAAYGSGAVRMSKSRDIDLCFSRFLLLKYAFIRS